MDPVDPKTPPPPKTGYTPPKKGLNYGKNKGKVRNPNGPGLGWPAKDGGVWVPDNGMDGGPGWTVQYPNGDHKHVYPDGHVREHFSMDWDPVIGIGIVVISTAGILWVAGNDLTGVGVVDDGLLPGLGTAFGQGITMIVR